MNESDPNQPQVPQQPTQPPSIQIPQLQMPTFLKRLPIVHFIFATLLLVFVAMAYLPSRESASVGYGKSKIDTQMKIEREEAKEKPDNDRIKTWKEDIKKLDTDIKEADRDWTNGGSEARGKFIGFSIVAASYIAVAWMVYALIRHLLAPLLGMLKNFFGPEFAGILAPVVLLAVAYTIAKVVLDMLDATKLEDKSSGFLVAIVQYVQYMVRPVCTALVSFGELVLFRSWLLTLSFLILMIYAVLRKFIPPAR